MPPALLHETRMSRRIADLFAASLVVINGDGIL
jgi:hypothetical protein